MAGAWYRLTMNGVINYPGYNIWLEDVFVSKFDFETWEPVMGLFYG